MDAMSTLRLSQLRERAAQLLRKYRIPLLVFLLGVALALVLLLEIIFLIRVKKKKYTAKAC